MYISDIYANKIKKVNVNYVVCSAILLRAFDMKHDGSTTIIC